jgi:threonine 3-dehydrogenase
MKALAKLEAAPGLTLCDVDRPAVGPNDILIKIRKTAICGTDVHIWKWDDWARKTIPVPMHVGHEYVGTVVELGSEVQGFKIGDRVSGEGHITCGHCRNCRAGRTHLCRNTIGVGVNRPGCFAEYLVIPAFISMPRIFGRHRWASARPARRTDRSIAINSTLPFIVRAVR